MNHLFKFFGILLIATIFANPLHAKDEISVLLKGLSNPYWKVMIEGIEEAEKELNIDVFIQGGLSDSDAQEQLTLCYNALLRKPKTLLVASTNSYNLAPCLQKAQSQGIALIDIDGTLTQKVAQEIGVDIKFSVGSNNYELGKYAAKYLNGQSGKVLILEGVSGNENSILRTRGFTENIEPDIQKVASIAADWDRLKAANITNDIVTAYPDLAFVFACNDLMALGALEALKSRNMNHVKVIGIDGIADAVESVQSGELDATIAQLPFLVGKQAIEKTHKYLNEQREYDYAQYVPILTLSQDVLKENASPLLEYVR